MLAFIKLVLISRVDVVAVQIHTSSWRSSNGLIQFSRTSVTAATLFISISIQSFCNSEWCRAYLCVPVISFMLPRKPLRCSAVKFNLLTARELLLNLVVPPVVWCLCWWYPQLFDLRGYAQMDCCLTAVLRTPHCKILVHYRMTFSEIAHFGPVDWEIPSIIYSAICKTPWDHFVDSWEVQVKIPFSSCSFQA